MSPASNIKMAINISSVVSGLLLIVISILAFFITRWVKQIDSIGDMVYSNERRISISEKRSDDRWDEVLRRLENIDKKIDKQ